MKLPLFAPNTDEGEFQKVPYVSFPKHGVLKSLCVTDPTRDGMKTNRSQRTKFIIKYLLKFQVQNKIQDFIMQHLNIWYIENAMKEVNVGKIMNAKKDFQSNFVSLLSQQIMDIRFIKEKTIQLKQQKGKHCASLKNIQHVFKYAFKLSDRSRFQVISNSNEDGSPKKVSVDEVQKYFDGLYMCTHEACMIIIGFALQCLSHSVIRLEIHLPNEQFVCFQGGNETSAALNPNSNKTTLTAFFTLNEESKKQFVDAINESEYDSRNYRYDQIPKHFTFAKATKIQKPKLSGKKTIGRLYNVSSKELE
ncbi:MAG: hypothetical protein EZS28_010735, partial [Streblomastix strix]